MLERDYKFYLAFENSKCLDYVTEKFYNALLFSIVPVVYGGADYNAIGAPKNSYIDVRIFQSRNVYYYCCRDDNTNIKKVLFPSSSSFGKLFIIPRRK